MRKVSLIINGDDFGASEEVNRAVIRSFREGVLTSCSLMVSGDAFEHAVRLARENEGLAVGIHVVTVRGKSVLPHREIPAIVDWKGNFPDDPVTAGLRYYFSRDARLQLKKELAAQFRKFELTGLRLSHIDSHLHMHVHPVILDSLLEHAKRYGAGGMRVPEDDLRLSLSFGREKWLKQLLDGLIFRVLCRPMKARLRAEGLGYAGRVYGLFMSGRISEEYVLRVLDRIAEAMSSRTSPFTISGTAACSDTGRCASAGSCLDQDIVEFYCHPAMSDGNPDTSDHELQCLKEFKILVSEKVKTRLTQLGIELTTYRELWPTA